MGIGAVDFIEAVQESRAPELLHIFWGSGMVV